MTKSLGNKIPVTLTARLRNDDFQKKGSKVIIFSTVDDEGFPHQGMLSYYEVYAKNRSTLLLYIHSGSKSAQNLRRRSKVTLQFVDEEMSLYVRAKCTELEPAKIKNILLNETVFEARVSEVLEDTVPTAKITSGINFEGHEPGMKSRDSRLVVFEELRRLSNEG